LTPLVGRQEGHPACKKWADGGGGHCLVRMEWRPAGWSVCLPLLIFPCNPKSEVLFWHWLTQVVPEKGALKRLWWCQLLRVLILDNTTPVLGVKAAHNAAFIMSEERMMRGHSLVPVISVSITALTPLVG